LSITEKYTSQRSGLRERRRPESPKLKEPSVTETWLPEERLELWEIKLFCERLVFHLTVIVDCVHGSISFNSIFRVSFFWRCNIRAIIRFQYLEKGEALIFYTNNKNEWLSFFTTFRRNVAVCMHTDCSRNNCFSVLIIYRKERQVIMKYFELI